MKGRELVIAPENHITCCMFTNVVIHQYILHSKQKPYIHETKAFGRGRNVCFKSIIYSVIL